MSVTFSRTKQEEVCRLGSMEMEPSSTETHR
jgi:hypothetical protein